MSALPHIHCNVCGFPRPHQLARHSSGENLWQCVSCFSFTAARPKKAQSRNKNQMKLPLKNPIRHFERCKNSGKRYSRQSVERYFDVNNGRIACTECQKQVRLIWTRAGNYKLAAHKRTDVGIRKNPSLREDVHKAIALGKRFSGHTASKLRRVNLKSASNVRLQVGTVTGIMYLARRDGEVEEYLHRFRSGSRPSLVVSPDGKRLELLGGAFRFTERGIVDKPTKAYKIRRNR